MSDPLTPAKTINMSLTDVPTMISMSNIHLLSPKTPLQKKNMPYDNPNTNDFRVALEHYKKIP
jgi:hypothetical protein